MAKRRQRRMFTAAESAEVWDRWQRGEGINLIGRIIGRRHTAVFNHLNPHGGIRPAPRRRSRWSLSMDEREEISRGVATGVSLRCAKSLFQLHGVDAAEQPVLRKRLRRAEMIKFFEKLPPAVVALEACGASHHWARLLSSFGHEVKLIAPQLAQPYVKRGKNDAADAEALCEAASRPTMRFVPVKSADQQAALMLVGIRGNLMKRRTQLANAIRGFAAEFGVTIAKGMCRIEPLVKLIATDEAIPKLARDLFALQARELVQLEREIEMVDLKLMEWHRSDECSRRLAQIPGVGPIGASMLMMKTPDPHSFKSGRDFAAWMGLTPRDHSTAGKTRLGKITRPGELS